MRTFDYLAVRRDACSAATLAALKHVEEDRRKVLSLPSPSSTFSQMKRQALVDTAGASTRIEGIAAPPGRVAELAGGKADCTTEAERQIAGYVRILKTIDSSPEFFALAPSTLLAMHTVLFTGRAFDTRGRYRRKDYLDMVDADGSVRRVAVSPINAFETPLYLGALCDELSRAFPTAEDPLLIIPRAMLDFLCVRPFGEGNGRLARLLGHLLMRICGCTVPELVSIDRLCELDAMGYYDALNAGVEGWDRNAGDYEPFTNYWLGKVHEAYCILLAHYEAEGSKPLSKADRVRRFCETQPGRITKRAILEANPDISISTVENTLHGLVAEGFLALVGSGRGAGYERTSRP